MKSHQLVLRTSLLLAAAGAFCLAQDRPRLRPVPKGDLNMKTGPAVGEKIPAFQIADQNGERQTFDSLEGPNGLVLMFVRSADW